MGNLERNEPQAPEPAWFALIREQITLAEVAAATAGEVYEWEEIGGGLALSVRVDRTRSKIHDSLDEPGGY